MNLMQKILVLLLIISTPAYCLDAATEYQQKTRLIRYIINKVSWPAGSIKKNQFNICVVGEDEQVKALETLNGQIINKHKLKVVGLQAQNRAQVCQLIYLANPSAEEQKNIVQKYAKRPVLLLSDKDHFANLGGSMNFVVLQKTVALTVNLESMTKSKLAMDIKELDQVIVVPEEKDLN